MSTVTTQHYLYVSSAALKHHSSRTSGCGQQPLPSTRRLSSWTCQRLPKGTDVYVVWLCLDRVRVRLGGLGVEKGLFAVFKRFADEKIKMAKIKMKFPHNSSSEQACAVVSHDSFMTSFKEFKSVLKHSWLMHFLLNVLFRTFHEIVLFCLCTLTGYFDCFAAYVILTCFCCLQLWL